MYKTPFHTKDISKNSFLVTGGAGFIGSHIVEYLIKYNAGKVKVLDNFSTGFKANLQPFINLSNFELIEGDIRDFKTCNESCRDVDYVLHQAALGSVPRSIKDPISTNEANVTGFLNILKASQENNVKRFIYASSSSVYGDSPHLPKKEDNIGSPLSPYAASKRVDELYAEVFALNYKLSVVGLRYFNIFGPRQSPSGPYAAAIPLFIFAMLNNESPFINGDGEQSRDFTFVENAVQANIKALFADISIAGNIFNIACGERTTINDLFNIIRTASGTHTIEPIYRDTRDGDVLHSLADISKAEKLLGYKPQVDIKKGLEITLNWFKENYSHQKE
ncbi:MAG: SDR family oxidoreductase [Bacteroidetes bacterium]|nr:SDR family oxidoreductase [Bacteroidota bacterium]